MFQILKSLFRALPAFCSTDLILVVLHATGTLYLGLAIRSTELALRAAGVSWGARSEGELRSLERDVRLGDTVSWDVGKSSFV